MRNLGNRLTLHSPSRGFAMELGAAIAVIIATRLSTSPFMYSQIITRPLANISHLQSSPSPLPSVLLVLPSVLDFATALGERSTGEWSPGSTWVGSSRFPAPVSSPVVSPESSLTRLVGVCPTDLAGFASFPCLAAFNSALPPG